MILCENPRIEFTCEDNMGLMGRYSDKHFELAIVDPPYGIGASKPSKKPHSAKQKNGTRLNTKNNNYTHKDWDDNIPTKNFFDSLSLKSTNQIIWGYNYFGLTLGSGRLVWDKLNGESDQFGCEIAYVSDSDRTDMVYYMWVGMFQGIYCGKDVKRALVQQGNKALNEHRIHITQKPVALYKWLLQNYAKEGDKILDTHVGSGSIMIACWELGFDFVGCELDKNYYDAAVNRFKEHVTAHPKLFTPKQLTNIQLTID